MTREEALKILDTIPTISEQVDALEMAIKALEQQPCEDCISRQEAISAIQDEYYADAIGIDIVDIIANLPSVTPTRPTGKWKKYLDEGGFLYCECLNCGHITNESDNYCPNCGTRMAESEDKER